MGSFPAFASQPLRDAAQSQCPTGHIGLNFHKGTMAGAFALWVAGEARSEH